MAIENANASVGQQVQAYSHASGTAATSGDNELVAAPGTGQRIVVKEITVQNESATDTVALLKSGSTTQWRAKLEAAEMFALAFLAGEEWRLGANEPLNLNLDGANSHGYAVRYFTESA